MAASGGDVVNQVLTRLQQCLFVCVILLALVAAPIAGHASEESQLYTKRGLIKLHAGQRAAGGPGETTIEKLPTGPRREYQEAAALFDAAVKADPNDIYALYYRGVTRSRLGETQAAILDLQEVVSRGTDLNQAELSQATLELGIALVNAERYTEALPWLERAAQAPGLNEQASFFLGLARFRQGDPRGALPYFTRAEGDPELRVAARYYEGFITYHEGRFVQAEEAFKDVVRDNPGSQMGREAAAFLDALGAGPAYRLYAGFALEYDSNVVLAPSSDQEQVKFGITNQSDGRAVVTLGGRYLLWRTERLQLALGYDFYQSIYFQMTNFDLQDHRPSVELVGRTDFAEIGFRTQYDFDLFGTISLMQQVIASPWIRIPEADWGRAELFYRMRWQDYLDNTFQNLDAINNAVGGREVVYVAGPERFVWLGYRFDNNDSTRQSGDQFGYNGNQGLVGGGWTFPSVATDVEVSYGFDYQQYDSASQGRRDKESSVTAVAVKQLNERFLVRGAYLGTFNDSNQATFTYNRNIVSLGVEARF